MQATASFGLGINLMCGEGLLRGNDERHSTDVFRCEASHMGDLWPAIDRYRRADSFRKRGSIDFHRASGNIVHDLPVHIFRLGRQISLQCLQCQSFHLINAQTTMDLHQFEGTVEAFQMLAQLERLAAPLADNGYGKYLRSLLDEQMLP